MLYFNTQNNDADRVPALLEGLPASTGASVLHLFPTATALVLAIPIPLGIYRFRERAECARADPRSENFHVWKLQTNCPKKLRQLLCAHTEETLELAKLADRAGFEPLVPEI